MEIKDLFGLGKILPIDKLIEVISKSIGRISKPYFDRKDIDTRAYEIKKLAEARADEMKIISKAVQDNFQVTGGIEYKEERVTISSPKELPAQKQNELLSASSVEQRTQERISFQEAKKQLNIESVTAYAAEELKDEQPVTDEPLDDDWTTRFFRIVEDISNEEMQALWGKILAGEVKQPKSYSLRTLELIRNLSKKEADIFMKVANFSIKSGNGNYIFKGNSDDKLRNDFDVSFMDIAQLKELGLILPGDFVNHQFLQNPIDTQRILIAGHVVIFVKIKQNTPTVAMPVEVFSTTGNELLKLIKTTPPFDYLKYFADSIKNADIEVKYANILAWEGDHIRHTQPLQDF